MANERGVEIRRQLLPIFRAGFHGWAGILEYPSEALVDIQSSIDARSVVTFAAIFDGDANVKHEDW